MSQNVGMRVVACGDLRVGVWLCQVDDPVGAGWRDGIAGVLAAHAEVGAANLRMLVVTDGGSPNAKQRAELREAVGGDAPSAVLTPVLEHSALKRGVATALTWLMPKMRFLRPEEWGAALAHVGLTEWEGPLFETLEDLESALGESPALATIRRARVAR